MTATFHDAITFIFLHLLSTLPYWLLSFSTYFPHNMPPHHLSHYDYRSLEAEVRTRMNSQGATTTVNDSAHAGPQNLGLIVVIPIVIGVVLVVAILLLPKGFFWNLASKVGIVASKDVEDAPTWFGRHSDPDLRPNGKLPPKTFVECHLQMLRAWKKPINPVRQEQPPLPLCLAKPGVAQQSRRPTATSFRQRQEH